MFLQDRAVTEHAGTWIKQRPHCRPSHGEKGQERIYLSWMFLQKIQSPVIFQLMKLIPWLQPHSFLVPIYNRHFFFSPTGLKYTTVTAVGASRGTATVTHKTLNCGIKFPLPFQPALFHSGFQQNLQQKVIGSNKSTGYFSHLCWQMEQQAHILQSVPPVHKSRTYYI